MYSPGHTGASAYARVGIETGVMGASPHRLIAMLYQGARQAVAHARLHLQQKNIAARGEAIGKAIDIVESGLRPSLNMEAGGEIARRLDRLYAYISRRLVEANIQQKEDMLIEVDQLLATLEEAWIGIAPEIAKMASQESNR
jgi:flagellar protein FliS